MHEVHHKIGVQAICRYENKPAIQAQVEWPNAAISISTVKRGTLLAHHDYSSRAFLDVTRIALISGNIIS
jgi:hypothetical protein